MGMPDPDYEAFQAWKAAQAAQQEQEAKPVQFYVHLADGRVEVLGEEAASQSHYDGVKIIDKYTVGE